MNIHYDPSKMVTAAARWKIEVEPGAGYIIKDTVLDRYLAVLCPNKNAAWELVSILNEYEVTGKSVWQGDINIHCIVVAYGLADDLQKLFDAVDARNIFWHVFLHSDDSDVLDVVANFSQKVFDDGQRFRLYNYKTNRGLSRSWNEGIHDAYVMGYRDGFADVAIILNDDMLPGPGDVQRVAQAAIDHPECGIIKCMGADMRSGQRTPMEFGLTAITKRGWEVVGAFDENIWPIYWEDIDWDHRRTLSGLPVHIVQETTAIHAGSKTSVTVPGLLEQTNRWFDANQAYYVRKWGAIHTQGELYSTPFNDPALGLKIEPANRHRPYGQYDREDVEHG